jgi:2-amino-4-hydroxy-6-hydroxymethyldihydropteridine diphosphokinase
LKVAIGLGSSLGHRHGHIELAVRRLALKPGLQFLRCSRYYRTPPMQGGHAQNWFLNAVALFECTIAPQPLLSICHQIERLAGKRPNLHWGDRPLDIDILVMEGVVSSEPGLTLPHPAIEHRSFVIQPLQEVWKNCIHPQTQQRLAAQATAAYPLLSASGVLARTL